MGLSVYIYLTSSLDKTVGLFDEHFWTNSRFSNNRLNMTFLDFSPTSVLEQYIYLDIFLKMESYLRRSAECCENEVSDVHDILGSLAACIFEGDCRQSSSVTMLKKTENIRSGINSCGPEFQKCYGFSLENFWRSLIDNEALLKSLRNDLVRTKCFYPYSSLAHDIGVSPLEELENDLIKLNDEMTNSDEQRVMVQNVCDLSAVPQCVHSAPLALSVSHFIDDVEKSLSGILKTSGDICLEKKQLFSRVVSASANLDYIFALQDRMFDTLKQLEWDVNRLRSIILELERM